MSTPQTTYLLTGANRGIGLGLASILLSRPHTTLIALVRDPSHPTSQSLASHPKAENTTLIILPYSATSADSALTTISTLRTDHHITHVDVVIANAGAMYGPRSPVESVSVQNMTDSVAVNCVSTVLLFQATLPLLRAAITAAKPPAATGGGSVASANEGTGDEGQGVNGPAAEEEEEEVGARKGKHEPKFIAVSSAIGSTELIGKHMHAQTPGYGMSKAALNWAMRKASFEVRGEGICVELLTPGPVWTDLMRDFDTEGIPEEVLERMRRIMQPVDVVCEGLMRCIDTASVETTAGGFRDWKGDVFAF